MAATERLYYRDSYLTRVESEVVSASDDRLRVALQQTVFYPTSGGQPHDLGRLNNIPVLDVIDEGETITHILASALTATRVQAEIDWPRRYDHMQQHTGQHLLSAVFENLFGVTTLSFRMGEDVSTIELDTPSLSPQQISSVVLSATEHARQNPRLQLTFEDASQARGLRKSSERSGTLRIVEIPGIDRSACGGTHVAALAEVLPLQIRESEKLRGHIRLSFVCGNRALARAASDFNTLTEVAQTLGTSPANVTQHIAALQQRLSDGDKHRQRLEAEAATRTGQDLYHSTIPSPDGIRRIIALESILDENARAKAKAFTALPRSVCILHSRDGILLASSPDSGFNAGSLLKQALAKAGARGGGTATLAQGNLPSQEVLQHLAQAIGARP